jgi:hypothetical protein
MALEILAHAIQPLDLCRSAQPLGGQGGFGGAVADESLHGVVALACNVEFDGRICTNGFEHVVQRTSRNHRGFASHKKTLVHEACRGIERIIVARIVVATGEDRSGRLDWEEARQRGEPAKGPLLVRVEELVAPTDCCIHRLLTSREVPRGDGRQQDIILEPAQQALGG